MSGIPPLLTQFVNALTKMSAFPKAASSGIKNDSIISDSPWFRGLLTEPTPSVVNSASKRFTVTNGSILISDVSITLMYARLPLVRVDGLPCCSVT